jgi:NAD(P)-dependent dehydrogenase (short-subunit alcohol dehydrogenase family)
MPNLVITGGTRGIGRAVVELFLKKGWNVCTCGRTEEGVKRLKEELKRAEKFIRKSLRCGGQKFCQSLCGILQGKSSENLTF